ncbi:hypothetical protein V494_01689, partial [Pseudogymnoascus sp. VKM F-4513 (FW-928)]
VLLTASLGAPAGCKNAVLGEASEEAEHRCCASDREDQVGSGKRHPDRGGGGGAIYMLAVLGKLGCPWDGKLGTEEWERKTWERGDGKMSLVTETTREEDDELRMRRTGQEDGDLGEDRRRTAQARKRNWELAIPKIKKETLWTGPGVWAPNLQIQKVEKRNPGRRRRESATVITATEKMTRLILGKRQDAAAKGGIFEKKKGVPDNGLLRSGQLGR